MLFAPNFCQTPVDASIMMPNAPVIKMAWVDGGLPTGSSYPDFLLLGMCLANECSDEALQYNTDRDLFSDPSVNEYQQHAIDALEAMQSDQYWLRAAHANGVRGKDLYVTMAANSNRVYLKSLINAGGRIDDTNYTVANYALSVRNAILFGYLPVFVALIIVWCLVKKVIRERREEQERSRRIHLVPVQVIPPRQQPQPQQPRLSEAKRQQIQMQVRQMENSVAEFNRTLIPVPEGHPLRAQAEDTVRTMEDTVRMLEELKQLLKTNCK